ncbi:MAG: TonB-dependent receptor, partial [Ignavibacteria bacterium CG22_combo_CG10-13_8_21_14_all_37_15]
MYKIILLTFFMAAFSFAQTVTVKDTDSKIPLELVTVYSTDINRALTTNSKGKVDISPLKNSKQISFKLLGYEKIALSFSELSQNNYEVFLKEAPIAIGNV